MGDVEVRNHGGCGGEGGKDPWRVGGGGGGR